MAAAWVLGAGAAFAQGQPGGDGFAPLIRPMEPTIDWLTILYFVVALAGMAVVGFKKSGRTHLD
jgi:hypothetical protein